MKKVFPVFALLFLCGCETVRSSDWIAGAMRFAKNVIALLE